MKEIIITVKPDGSTEIEAAGYTGRDCLKATKPFEDALGFITQREPKPIMLQETEENEVGGSGVFKKLSAF
ncbi:hypothetical protein Psch_03524 [Pelotomaculum schinkii]|uniref:DUF2997 domain-containing protein n=1 Tax=Pelotomaculum schinkii TaxID=78350 RepID=A0A4Y7R7N0_9FIRM|nr:DUF2997 domain-containing protein [Pelotomaculum schinkii]TEB04762.1 hypothetical protein Psch_03524 [Pelotomaculum schinkii]